MCILCSVVESKNYKRGKIMLSEKIIRRIAAAGVARYPEKRADIESRLAAEIDRRREMRRTARLRALGRAAGRFLRDNL